MVRNRLYTSLVNSIPIIPFGLLLFFKNHLKSNPYSYLIITILVIVLFLGGMLVTRRIILNELKKPNAIKLYKVQGKEFVEPKSSLGYFFTLLFFAFAISSSNQVINVESFNFDAPWLLGIVGVYWTGSIISNPFLECLGYCIYVLKTEKMSLDNATVISKNLIIGDRGSNVHLLRFESGYFIEVLK